VDPGGNGAILDAGGGVREVVSGTAVNLLTVAVYCSTNTK
jgi:hypothetical protein